MDVLPCFAIIAPDRLVQFGPIGAMIPCPYESKHGRCAMIFNDKTLAYAAIQEMQLPFECETMDIDGAAEIETILLDLQKEGDTHVIFDAVLKDGEIASGSYVSIAYLLSAAGFIARVEEQN